MSIIMNNLPTPEINDETPLRLAVAAQLAFPDGSISVGSLRGEIAAGRLDASKIAGKHFVTMRAIREMTEKCRVIRKVPDSNLSVRSTTLAVGASDHIRVSSATGRGKNALASELGIARRQSES